MSILWVVIAALAAWMLGAVYYMKLAEPWMEASGVTKEQVQSGDKTPFIISLICLLIVSAAIRYGLAVAGMSGAGKGLVTGFGVGAFFISPWIALNNAYQMMPFKLTLINGGYAVLACSVMGLVLGLFA